jgi:multiple antibiotic resistance protein
MGTLEFALLAFTSIVAITEPSTTIPEFLALTKDLELKQRRKLTSKIAVISFIILAFFVLTGHLLFVVFNITHGAFTIAGGIVLISVAFRMFRPEKEKHSSEEHEKTAVIPLAFPLTAGPGAITTVILLSAQASNLLETSLIYVAIGAAMLIVYAGLVYSSKLVRGLNNKAIQVLPALISIFILAIGVQFIINGVVNVASPFLAGK